MHKDVPRTQGDRQDGFISVSEFNLDVPAGFYTALRGNKNITGEFGIFRRYCGNTRMYESFNDFLENLKST